MQYLPGGVRDRPISVTSTAYEPYVKDVIGLGEVCMCFT